MERRFAQLETTVEDPGQRYNIFLQTITSALLSTNFTENGWGLTRAPDTIIKELVEELHRGMANNPRQESNVDVIEKFGKGAAPLFIDTPALCQKVLRTLRTMHEEWSGVPLHEEISYGLRVYRNQSNLLMHVDKPETHVISSILHIDSSPDSKPWPIIIEDFQGNTNEVVLKSGDMLFYESSKCLHGRPQIFNGSWYSSIFTHYSPINWNKNSGMNAHYAVPPNWNVVRPLIGGLEGLKAVGTSIKEPECKNSWCALAKSVKWSGPAEKGWVLSANGKKTRIEVPDIEQGINPDEMDGFFGNDDDYFDDDENVDDDNQFQDEYEKSDDVMDDEHFDEVYVEDVYEKSDDLIDNGEEF